VAHERRIEKARLKGFTAAKLAEGERRMVNQTIAGWNPIARWLRKLAGLRAPPEPQPYSQWWPRIPIALDVRVAESGECLVLAIAAEHCLCAPKVRIPENRQKLLGLHGRDGCYELLAV
jgi:hypothetical protein